MGKDYEPMDLNDLDEIRERLLSDPSYNDIEIVSTSLEEFLEDIQKPGVKFTTKGGIEELKRRVEREKKEKIIKMRGKKWQKILISTEQTVSQFLKGLRP